VNLSPRDEPLVKEILDTGYWMLDKEFLIYLARQHHQGIL